MLFPTPGLIKAGSTALSRWGRHGTWYPRGDVFSMGVVLLGCRVHPSGSFAFTSVAFWLGQPAYPWPFLAYIYIIYSYIYIYR